MALTDIARQLKETFEGFNVVGIQDEVKRFREIYGDAESIRIGEMDYIVINEVYKSKEYSDVPESTSPLFFNSINNSYAIIDAETSSTLIDEVYSRITYMQRECKIESTPEKNEIKNSLSDLVGEGAEISDVRIKIEEDNQQNKANIFQCHLIKDTGVSAAPDVYSFMLKNGEIKEIADNVVKQIKRTGEVNLLKDREALEESKSAIQQAVFDKYINTDVDIQKITVKSIFEITMSFLNIHLFLSEAGVWNGVYNTVYLASEANEFETLNASIHTCNSCGHEIVDVKDATNVSRLHVNQDAYDQTFSADGKYTNAVGCEDCLEQCPVCGGWHFNYEKFIGSKMYERVNFMPGRSFIKGLRSIDGNYCSCREGIEWVYDEESGVDGEHDIIPVGNMAFISFANEKIASYKEYEKFYNKEIKGVKFKAPLDESKFAKRVLAKFKKHLASIYDMDTKDIKITALDKCHRCSVCGGEYYRGNTELSYEDYRCQVCDELVSEKRPMVTRIDGMIFMHRFVDKRHVVSKYTMTKFGNLKHLSTHVEQVNRNASEGNKEND